MPVVLVATADKSNVQKKARNPWTRFNHSPGYLRWDIAVAPKCCWQDNASLDEMWTAVDLFANAFESVTAIPESAEQASAFGCTQERLEPP